MDQPTLAVLFVFAVDLVLAVGLGINYSKFKYRFTLNAFAAVACEAARQGVTLVLLIDGESGVLFALGGLLVVCRGLFLWQAVEVLTESGSRLKWYLIVPLYVGISASGIVPGVPASVVNLVVGALVLLTHLVPGAILVRSRLLGSAGQMMFFGLLLATSAFYAATLAMSLVSEMLFALFYYFESLVFVLLGMAMGLVSLERIGAVLDSERAKTADSVRRYRAIVNHSLDGIITIDGAGSIIDWNHQAEVIFGWKKEDVLNRSLAETITPPRLREPLEQGLKRYRETGRWRGLDRRFEICGMHSSGRELPVEVALISLRWEDEPVFSIFVRDITKRRRSQEALRNSEERYRTVSELASDYAYCLTFGADGSAKLEWITDAFSRISGFAPAELEEGLGWEQLIHPDDRAAVRQRFPRLEQGHADESEYRIITKAGELRWLSEKCRPIREPSGNRIIGVYGAARDITEQKRFEERLEHEALHDALTGLANRTLFRVRLRAAIARAKASVDFSFAVLFADLDGFKLVNDSLGHVLGDHLLVLISSRLKGSLRQVDTMARLSGDEFAMLVHDVDSAKAAVLVAERCHGALAAPFRLDEHEVFITASMGIALSSGKYKDPDEVLRDADTAMYQAKSLGRGRHAVFDPAMHDQAVARLRIETELRLAVERQQFTLFYQPIVSLRTGRIVEFEALVRWQHPHRGLLSPDEFLPQATASDLMVPLTEIVLWEACRQTGAWRRRFPEQRELAVCVNLFGRIFSRSDCVEVIQRILQRAKLDPKCLRLEITENVLLDAADSVVEVLGRLRDLGIKIYLDDFGTGYSSLSYLQRFPLDAIKIDRSFVARLPATGEGSEIIKAIVVLGHNLGINVIAEGIETSQQLVWLTKMGCEQGQGHFFARPGDSGSAEELIAARVTFMQGVVRRAGASGDA